MAITFVAVVKRPDSTSSPYNSDTADTTGATLLIGGHTFPNVGQMSDSKSNTFSNLTRATDNVGPTYLYPFYNVAPTVGSGHFTTNGTFYVGSAMLAFAGTHASPIDQENATGNSGDITTLATSSITPSEGGCVVVSMITFFGPVSGLTVPSGYTLAADLSAYTAVNPMAVAYKIKGSGDTAAENPSWSWTGAVKAVGKTMSFKPGAGDTTAPVLSSPIGTATGSTTATVGATTDEANGTGYTVVTTSATAPLDTEVEAGLDHTASAAVWDGSTAISGTGAFTLNATGLTASTAYYSHTMHKDAAGNRSNVVTSAQFTTDAANAAPVWSGTPSAMSSKKGQALTAQDITSLVSDGDTLAYSLTGAPTGVTINSSTGIISGTPTAAPGVYACTVEADDGVNSPVSSSSFNITVTQCVLALSAAGYEFGDGNAPATMNILASTTLNAAVYPVAEWPPATAIATASGATNASARLADLGDDDLLFGTSYRMIARNPSDGQTWAWLMTAT